MKDLFESKKFRVLVGSAIATILVKVAGHQGYALDAATAGELSNLLVGLASAYLLGQGIADYGKAKAEAEAEAPEAPAGKPADAPTDKPAA